MGKKISKLFIHGNKYIVMYMRLFLVLQPSLAILVSVLPGARRALENKSFSQLSMTLTKNRHTHRF